MTEQFFIRLESEPARPAVTIRYVDGDYVTKRYDPEDESEQVYRPAPLEHTWEHSA